jgi:hypothetical protein
MHARTHKSFANLREFYEYYLGEHRNRTCRRLHFFGTATAILSAICAAIFGLGWLVPAGFVCAYGCAWAGRLAF